MKKKDHGAFLKIGEGDGNKMIPTEKRTRLWIMKTSERENERNEKRTML